ncbi:MAG: glycoside hydrolase family 15 protein [Acidobacteriota bacterium]|nr:glycoside hydrolase family 15 protein [Acidobacteriota bacterium]
MCISALLWALFLFSTASFAQTIAPGAPGKDAQWASAGKQGVGTSANLESKVWFTLQGGALTEVYYPDVTIANVHLLQFVVVNPKTKKVETERDDANHQIKVLRPDSLTFQQINTAKSGEWKITKTYATDVERDSVLIDVRFEPKNRDLNLYVYYDPSLGNSGMHDLAVRRFTTSGDKDGRLVAVNGKSPVVSSALSFSVEIGEQTNGFYQVSDGLEQLREYGKIVNQYNSAINGNVVQMARILKPSHFTTVLSFHQKSEIKAFLDSLDSLRKGFGKCLAEYEKGWADYVKTLRKVDPKYQAQFNMAAMQLKAHEDKTHRGANIASLSVPWGGGENANENTVGGYHLVWSRDLYQVATAFMALGDQEAAMRALDFLFKVQQKPDGSFPQNSWLDGKPFWNSLQLDEVAYPLILAYQLGRFDKETYTNHVKKAADFIVRTGPGTPQERWEEEAGFSPSTIAAEIAGLVCAAEIARRNGDEASATIYLATADDWARNVERWTATTTGKYGDGNYYVRITQNGNPDKGEKIELNNGAGFFDEREIVDAGFLELVRLGIKPADDPLIKKSVKVIDEIIRVKTPNGNAFYRYNYDGYGEMDDGRRWNWDGKYTGKGRLWALLSGERGQYELALCGLQKFIVDGIGCTDYVKYERLEAMQKFANEGLMIPEQIWDKPEVPKADSQFSPNLKFGEGTGSATPLAWSMAQFIRLAVSLQEGRNLDTPDIVYNRYVKNAVPPQVSNFGGLDEDAVLPVNGGQKFSFTRRSMPNAKAALSFRGETRMLPVNEKGEISFEVVAPEQQEIALVGIITPDGASAFERVKVRSADTKITGLGNYSFSPPRDGEPSPQVFGLKGAEKSDVMFVYRGEAKEVGIAGDFTGWRPHGRKFQNFGSYQVLILPFDNAAKFEYKLIVDGKWIADPLNPNKIHNGIDSENSVFAMSDYKPTVWDKLETFKLESSGPEVFIAGKHEEFDLQTKSFGARRIKVYLPSSYQPGSNTRFPVLYFQDGSDYLRRANAAVQQENLVKAGKIKPFIMVFIDPRDRIKEYWANDAWADFVAGELVPEIDKRYRTIRNRDGRALLGASLGGITSIWIGLRHPDKFARIGGQSSSFWVDNERVVKELAKLDPAKTKFKFYFDDGVFEGVEDSRRVNVMLRAKGYPVVYRESVTGHTWTSWRDRLADAFIGLLN